MKAKFPRNIANIYVILIGNYLLFWGPIYTLKIYPTLYVSFFSITLKIDMMKINDIYDRVNGYLLQVFNIHWCKKNLQHYMLALPYFNYISIMTFRREIFLTFMVEDGAYITRLMKWLKLDLIAKTKYIFLEGKFRLTKKYFQWNISNIYVSIFGYYLQFWGLMYRYKI